MARQSKRQAARGASPELEALSSVLGGGGHASQWDLDGQLLAATVSVLLSKGAALQLGTSRDGSQLSIKVWHTGIPTQRYCASIEEAHVVLAATGWAFTPKDQAWDGLRTYFEDIWKKPF